MRMVNCDVMWRFRRDGPMHVLTQYGDSQVPFASCAYSKGVTRFAFRSSVVQLGGLSKKTVSLQG